MKHSILFLFSIIVFASFASASIPNLLVEWQLNGNANDTQGLTNSRIIGSLTTRTGFLGNALTGWSDSNFINITDTATLDLSSSITICAWVNKSNQYDTPDRQAIITKGNAYTLQTYNSTPAKAQYHVQLYNTSNILESRSADDSVKIGWQFVCGVWGNGVASGKIKIYVNGTETGTYATQGSLNTTLNNSVQNAYIGRSFTASRAFVGALDEITIFNATLTSTEIKGLYQNYTKGIRPSDTAYYLDADATGSSTSCSATAPCKSFQNITDLITLRSTDTIYLDSCDVFRGNYLPTANIIGNGSCSNRANVFLSYNVTACTEISANKWECLKGSLPNTVNILNYNVNNYIAGTGAESLAYRETSCTNVNSNWDFCYNSTGQSILIYSNAGNPVTIGNGVEASQYQDASAYSTAAWYIHWSVSNITLRNIAFSYINERGIDLLATANITLENIRFRWSYENSLRIRASNEPEKTNTILKDVSFYETGIKGSNHKGYTGNAAEGIFIYTTGGIHAQNITVQNNYGVVFNDLNGTNINLKNFWFNGSEYDSSLFAGVYLEATHDALITNGTIIREQMAGVYVGVEAAGRTTRNNTFSYMVIKAPVNKMQSMISNPSVQDVHFDHITFIVETCNSTIAQDLLYFRDFDDTSITNSIMYIYCTGSYDYLYYNNTNNLSSDYNLWYSRGTSEWDKITGSSLTTLAAWQLGTGNDIHSLNADPLFLSIDPNNPNFAVPSITSPVCTASSTGSYIGALPCSTTNNAPTLSTLTPSNATVYNVNYTSPTVLISINITGIDIDGDPFSVNLYNNTNGALLCTGLNGLTCSITLGLNQNLTYNVTLNDSSLWSGYGVYKVSTLDVTTYYNYTVNITNRNTGSLVNGTVDFEGTRVAISAANYLRQTYRPTETVTFYKAGYINQTNISHTTTQDLKGWLYPVQVNNITHSGFIGAYVRNLTYTVNYTCWDISTTKLDRYVNGALQNSVALSCNNVPTIYSSSYIHSSEGAYNISFYFNTSYESSYINQYYANGSYISDLNNPTVILGYNLTSGFSATSINISLRCLDNIYTPLGYNKTYNGAEFYFKNTTNNTVQSNVTTAPNRENTLIGSCSDLFGISTDTETFTVYNKVLALIDERTGGAFDITNVTTARAYYDDNHTYYDFKVSNTSSVNFSSLQNDKLRIELGYSSGAVIVRYIDVSLTDNPTRICANIEGVTYYEQLITSASEKPVVLKSVYADCVIAADYTRFAYQNAKTLKAYSINTMYYLYVWDSNGNQITLASVDGSIASYINIDALEFQNEAVDVSTRGDAIGFNTISDTMVQIYYINVLGDNTALNALITRQDTGATLLDSSNFDNPNNVTIYLDTAALTGVNSTTLFKLVLTKTSATGTSVIQKYFNIAGHIALISAGIAVVLCLLNILFGLSLTSINTTFSWLGILFMVVNLIICGLAAAAWYVTFMAVVSAIILVFIILVMLGKNIETIGA